MKEKRKNDIEHVNKANGSNGSVGESIGLSSVPLLLEPVAVLLYPLHSNPETAGRKPNAVRDVEILSNTSTEARNLHLTSTSVAHQKLATLSSKRPREKGNIRLIDALSTDKELKGGIKGKKTI